jgi:hypothetical protein
MRASSFLAAVILLAALTGPAWSEVQFIDKQLSKGAGLLAEWPHVRFTGKISMADTFVFTRIFDKAVERSGMRFAGRPQLLVFLDSAGGEVDAAMWLGRRLREAHAFVVVDRRSECSSACILLLSAGVQRLVVPTARIGLHRPYFDPTYYGALSPSKARLQYQTLEASVKSYLSEMGMPDSLFERMRAIPSHKAVFLRHDELASLGLNRDDPSAEEYERAPRRNTDSPFGAR